MENHTSKKWHEKTTYIIICLILFFPVGLYFMWKNNIWSKKARWIISIFFLLAIVSSSDDKNSSTTSSSSNENVQQCEQYKSKSAVESRVSSLGHMQTSIQLNSSSGCRYQWLVQFITSTGGSGFCAMTTDGSSGTVEIVDVTCN